MSQPLLSQIQSFGLYSGKIWSQSYLAQIVAGSPADAIVLCISDAEPAIDRNIADPNHKKLILGFMPATYTSSGNTPDLFVNGQLPSSIAGNIDPNIPAQYSIKYWTNEWKQVVYSAIDRAIANGYDGLFLDSLSCDYYWLAGNNLGNPVVPNATQLLADFLGSVRNYVDSKHLSQKFYLIANSPTSIATQFPQSLKYLDGIFNENLYASLDGTTGIGTDYTKAISESSARYMLDTLLPLWQSSGDTILGNDYFLPNDQSTVIKSFLSYNDKGIVSNIIYTQDYGNQFLHGPYFFTANDSNSLVRGLPQSTNYLAGGKTNSATLIGGDYNDYFVGGFAKNTIDAGGGNDVIYAHPQNFQHKNILDINIKSVVVNAPNPSLAVYVNGQLASAPTEITATWTNGKIQDILVDISKFSSIQTISLKSVNGYWTDQNHSNATQPAGISLNGQPFLFALGTISGSGVINDGGSNCSLGGDAQITFQASALPLNVFNTNVGDQVDGGTGIDTVVYWGPKTEYTITQTNNQFSISDSKFATSSPDTLTNIERLKFSDTNLAIDINGNAGEAYRIYQAAFDRKPDASGLGYWIAQIDNGASLKSVAQGFINSAEFQKLYGSSPSNASFVDSLYHNVLHRAGEQGGVDFWNGVLNSGTRRADVLAGFSESAENKAGVIGSIQNGIQYTEWTG